MYNISQFKKRSRCLLGAGLILAALVGTMTSCSLHPEQKRYTFTVETAEASSLEDAPTALTPYDMAERHKYMDYVVKSDNGITVYVSSGDFSRVELLQALENGRITPEEILAQAESDARQELCKQEIVCSRNNLTTFVYRYPAYSLAVLNDMFENDREEQYLIRQILFSKPDASFLQPSLVALDDEAYIRVDYPDWGVTVEAKDVTPEEMTLVCTQSGEALDGELYLSTFLSVARKTEDGWELLEPDQYETPSYGEAVEAGRIIPKDSQTEYPVHWRDTMGALAPGLYNFRFYIYKFDQAGQSLDGQKVKVQVNILPQA